MLYWLIQVVGLHGNSKVRAVNLGGWLVVEGWIKPSLFDGIPNGDMLVSFFQKFLFDFLNALSFLFSGFSLLFQLAHLWTLKCRMEQRYN